MTMTIRGMVMALSMALCATWAFGQTTKWKEIHKVKSKETIYGLARDNGISVEELMDANPEMRSPDFKLKKGTYVFIPYAKAQASSESTTSDEPQQSGSHANVDPSAIRLGVVLPLNDDGPDGRHMVEYYRGVLMACDSLRQRGVSVDVCALNAHQGDDISKLLASGEMAQRQLIIGPLYQQHVKPLADYAREHGIKLLTPFQATSALLATNPSIFQAYQSPTDQTELAINLFLRKFAGYHPVFIDCNDSTSRKGTFTMGLRRQLESMGRKYAITNLTSKERNFANAFSTDQPNVVILNTGRAPELNIAFAKINSLTTLHPNLKVAMFGYAEWLGYTHGQLDNFYKFDTYIPSGYFASPLAADISRMEQKYHSTFREAMAPVQPRYALMGFDHAYFFLMGIHKHGNQFEGTGNAVGYEALQSPLSFERQGDGGYKNTSLMLVHYSTDHQIEIISH